MITTISILTISLALIALAVEMWMVWLHIRRLDDEQWEAVTLCNMLFEELRQIKTRLGKSGKIMAALLNENISLLLELRSIKTRLDKDYKDVTSKVGLMWKFYHLDWEETQRKLDSIKTRLDKREDVKPIYPKDLTKKQRNDLIRQLEASTTTGQKVRYKIK
jgi:hypothetical protein